MTIRKGTAKFRLSDGIAGDRWVVEDTETGQFRAFDNAGDRDRFVSSGRSIQRGVAYAGQVGANARYYEDIVWEEGEPKSRIIYHLVSGQKWYAKYDPLTGRRSGDRSTVERAEAEISFDISVTLGDEWNYYEEEKIDVTDYQKKYYAVLDALDAEAKRREWCGEYQEFLTSNGIVDDRAPKYPFPTKVGTVVDQGDFRFIRNSDSWHATVDHRNTNYTDDAFKAWLTGRSFKVVLEGA